MMQIASPKCDEVDGARGTRVMSDAESLLKKNVSAAPQRGDTRMYSAVMCALFSALLVWAVCLHTWDRLKEDIHASPYMTFQDKELQCHEGCRQHDMANSECLQACLPDKLACVSSECADMGPESPEYSSCALECHSSSCDEKCSETGQRATLCHMSCAPDMRTLEDNPPCVRKCASKHDASCMAGCAENTKKCLNTKCVGNTHEEYSKCQEECELASCGRDCQDANRAFAECSSRCYPANPSGQDAIFVPSSVHAADSAFLRRSHCQTQCSLSNHRHDSCMRECGPKISACVGKRCPNAVPDSPLQKRCMETCEKSHCGNACLQTFEQAKRCYQDSCDTGPPSATRSCNTRCQAKHDDSCMKKCSFDLSGCIASHCRVLLDQDSDAYNTCQQSCMNDSCGRECAERSMALLSCNKDCEARESAAHDSAISRN